jgi:hypothetical protein
MHCEDTPTPIPLVVINESSIPGPPPRRTRDRGHPHCALERSPGPGPPAIGSKAKQARIWPEKWGWKWGDLNHPFSRRQEPRFRLVSILQSWRYLAPPPSGSDLGIRLVSHSSRLVAAMPPPRMPLAANPVFPHLTDGGKRHSFPRWNSPIRSKLQSIRRFNEQENDHSL